MLVPTTALGLAMAITSTLPADWAFQSQETAPPVWAPVKPSDDPLRELRVELATARLELGELGSPQKALERCADAAMELLQRQPRTSAIEAYAAWVEIVHEFNAIRRRALQLHAGESTQSKLRWTRLEDLIQRTPEPGPAAEGGSPQGIDQQIEANAATGNFQFIQQIGRRAAPGVLRALENSDKDHYADPQEDPLCMLMKIDPFAADRYVQEKLESGPPSVFWELRFARAVQLARPFEASETWASDTYEGDETKLPHLAGLCDRLLTRPELVDPIAIALRDFAGRRNFTPGMRSFLEQANRDGQEWPQAVRSWIAVSVPYGGLRDLLLQSLSTRNAETAEDALFDAPSNEGIYGAILGAGSDIRMRGALWLRSRKVKWIRSSDSGVEVVREYWTPEYGPGAAAFLAALLADENPGVRQKNLEWTNEISSIGSTTEVAAWPEYDISAWSYHRSLFPIELSAKVLHSVVNSYSTKNSDALLSLAGRLPHGNVATVILDLQQKEDPEAIGVMIKLLPSLDWHGQTQECVEIAKSVLTEEQPLERFLGAFRHSFEFRSALDHEEGLVSMVNWGLSVRSQGVLSWVSLEEGRVRPQLRALPPELWARVSVALLGLPSSDHGELVARNGARIPYDRLLRFRSDDEPARVAQLQIAASDPDLSPQVRFSLLDGPTYGALELAEQAFLRVFQTKSWALSLGSDGMPMGSYMSNVLRSRYSTQFRQGLAQALLQPGAVTPETLSQVFLRVDALPITPLVVEHAMSHLDQLRGEISLVDAVVKWIEEHPAPELVQWVGQLIDDPDFAGVALETARHLRDPALLPHIAPIINGPASDPRYEQAIRALNGYLTDEGAELLLTAARKTQIEGTRTWCLDQIGRIAALQDAEDRWATRRVQKATREVTVSKLMGLLTDDDQGVRIEAIRGLGTWEAVEAMPELIGLLKDPDPKVVDAARAALDRLNEKR